MTKSKQSLDVVLGLETFTNMVITSFVIDREAETGANLPFTMEFKKLQIVHSDTAKINASSKEARPSGDQTASTLNASPAGTEKPDNSQIKEEWRSNMRIPPTHTKKKQRLIIGGNSGCRTSNENMSPVLLEDNW